MRLRTTLALLLAATTLMVQAESQERIVYINGTRYAIHNVAKGETLYSLARHYGVKIDDIVAENPTLKNGLKAGQQLHIPLKGKSKGSEKRKQRSGYITHTVAPKETLYSISRRYGISVDDLKADNENVDAAHLAVGTQLYIRKDVKHKGPDLAAQSTNTTAEANIETPKSELPTPEEKPATQPQSTIDYENYNYHLVSDDETIESIASRFRTTIDYILKLNKLPSSDKIKKGTLIKVPNKQNIIYSTIESIAEAIGITQQEPEQQLGANIQRITFAPKDTTLTANVTLMLPMGTTEKPAHNYIDFYQGFLMGADKVRTSGRSININLFNTAHDMMRIAEIAGSGALTHSDLIVGPVYEDELQYTADLIRSSNVPIISPLAPIKSITGNNIFRMSPVPSNKYDKVRNLLDGSHRVVFIKSDNNDTAFEQEILAQLGSTPYDVHKYIYEHPSIIEKKAEEREKAGTYSPSDMSPLLHGTKPTVFVITPDNETEIDRILAAIASANISLKARSRRIVPFYIIGNNRWNRYTNLDRSILFNDHVIMLSTYHARRDNEQLKEFDGRYVEEFGTQPSLYSYRGYDAAIIFLTALYEGLDTLEDKQVKPLQTPYTFTTDPTTGIRGNTEWARINYNNDYTITVE